MAGRSRSPTSTPPTTGRTCCKASRSSVAAGSITCLLGSNGSGKTTLIRSILGLTPPRAGRIVFDGNEITRLPTHKVVAAGIACIPEGRKVFPKLTVEENLRVGAYQERSEAVTRARIDEIYGIFPRLAERRAPARRHHVGRRAGDGVDRARADARAEAPAGRRALARPRRRCWCKENFNIIRQINERGITVFLVEQNVHQTLAISHYGYVLSKGRVVAARHAGRNSPTAPRCARPISAKARGLFFESSSRSSLSVA